MYKPTLQNNINNAYRILCQRVFADRTGVVVAQPVVDTRRVEAVQTGQRLDRVAACVLLQTDAAAPRYVVCSRRGRCGRSRSSTTSTTAAVATTTTASTGDSRGRRGRGLRVGAHRQRIQCGGVDTPGRGGEAFQQRLVGQVVEVEAHRHVHPPCPCPSSSHSPSHPNPCGALLLLLLASSQRRRHGLHQQGLHAHTRHRSVVVTVGAAAVIAVTAVANASAVE